MDIIMDEITSETLAELEKTQKDSHTFAKAPDLCYTASERK